MGKGNLRSGASFCSQEPVVCFATQPVSEEREGEPTEVRTGADAVDDDIRVLARHFHLYPGFFTDDRLVHQDTVEEAAQSEDGVLACGGVLY